MKTIDRVAVIGAGTMGSAIAQHFAMKNLTVDLIDVQIANIERGMERIGSSLQEAQDRGLISSEEQRQILSRVRPATMGEARLMDVPLVLEAVFEDRAVKKAVFLELEKVVSPDCILASNTSSFLISEIAETLRFPERLVGVHYFYHAAKNKLVEIVPGKKTDPRIPQQLYSFYYAIGKIPIYVKDAPGFAVNRFFVPWLNEAVRLLEEGAGSIVQTDRLACEVFGIGMGPFALMNATGVAIAEHAAQGLADRLGAFYKPADLLKQQVVAGKPWDLTDTTVRHSGRNDDQKIRQRLLDVCLQITETLVSEGVADSASVDLGARVGLRWPKGPFELGIGLQRKSAHPLSWVECTSAENTAQITLNIPDRMNALSEAVLADLTTCWNKVSRDEKIDTILITGRGKAFVAGADIKFFIDCMERKDLKRIVTFTSAGQRLLQEIADSPKKVIAYLNGLTLGGGLELALACRFRVAAPKAVLGFPETGIGIYPGLGGTQRTSRLIGKGLAKYLIATGRLIDAKTALAMGLVDAVMEVTHSEEDLGQWSRLSLALPRKTPGLSGELKNLSEAFENYHGGADERGLDKTLERKAPRALQIAMSLVDEGFPQTLAEGLRRELNHLEEIFSTEDARIGLSSVLNKTRPRFVGH